MQGHTLLRVRKNCATGSEQLYSAPELLLQLVCFVSANQKRGRTHEISPCVLRLRKTILAIGQGMLPLLSAALSRAFGLIRLAIMRV